MNNIKLHDTYLNKEFEVSSGDPIKIYICGPTVYTASHVGHLKTYMTFDIMRRIMMNYLGLNIVYMMNITNVDDKIIKSTYLQEYPDLNDDMYPYNLTVDQYLHTEKFEAYANKWEADFFKVMESVNILPPDILSRVTEYIDEILNFVEEIDKNGYAFEHEGSVYFYGTRYALDSGLILEGINDMVDNHNNIVKMQDPTNKYNFVLLKKAQSHEPGWESRWGRIRPGWHIECSAMASSVFSDNIDIHGGGIDLSFPHHHNEVLQSNARFYPPNKKVDGSWVRHFMHTGHLNIKGLKMSRSLKNFITIDDIISYNSPDELRMLFLLHQWDASMDYSDETMKDAKYFVDLFQNFNKQVKSIILRKNSIIYKKYGELEIKFTNQLMITETEVDKAIRNNLNTSKVITLLQQLVSDTYRYVEDIEASNNPNDNNNKLISIQLVRMVYSYVAKILTIFGLTIFESSGGSSKEDNLCKVISDIRSDMRNMAKDTMKIAREHKSDPDAESKFKSVATSLYNMTDDIRDRRLKEIGVELTDK